MIIDVHGHVTPPSELYTYQAGLIASRGAHGRGAVRVSDDRIRESHMAPLPHFGSISHLDHLDQAGIDKQLISSRPFTVMHSEEPARIVEWFNEETNNIIHQTCQVFPDRFIPMAGLNQCAWTAPEQWVGELKRCVTELGFVGALLNPDPKEGMMPPPPGLGDRYWYPVYEALCELDVPALIHSASCRPPSRESYSLHFITEETIGIIDLLNSNVLRDFPTLKLVFSHGGGAIPYQVGRFLSFRAMHEGESFIDQLHKIYFDTCLYTKESLELLIKVVGVDNCLFGSEKPGTGSQKDPVSGRWYDDIKILIDDIDWLSDNDRSAIYEGNVTKLFKLK
jgi:predicted TIM-barrel fold metal-dependent hydrolase